MRGRDYERAYNEVGAAGGGGVRAPNEPIHAGGVVVQNIAAGASATYTVDLNMDMELETILIEDAIAPSVEITSMSIGAIQLNAGDGPIPGDMFRRDSRVRMRPAVPMTSKQPLRVVVRNKSGSPLTSVGFAVVGRVARSA